MRLKMKHICNNDATPHIYSQFPTKADMSGMIWLLLVSADHVRFAGRIWRTIVTDCRFGTGRLEVRGQPDSLTTRPFPGSQEGPSLLHIPIIFIFISIYPY